jgi:1,4-alpha-glucan branching enzyme
LKEFKVDGFRFDLVKGLGNNSSYGGDTEKYNQSRVDRMKQLHAWMKEINPNAYHINENLAGADEENAMAADGQMNWSNINYASCEFVKASSAAGANNNAFLATNNGRSWGSTVSYAESHDEERMGYKAVTEGSTYIKREASLRLRRLGSLAAQMLLAPGAHMIWQFGELGNEQTTKNSEGNDTSPKIVNWEYLNDADRKGLYQSYSELCWLRRSNPDLFTESTAKTMTMNCNSENWSTKGRLIKLTNNTQELICVINTMTSNSSRTISGIPFNSTNNSNYIIASKSYGTEPTFDASTGKVTLPNNGYVVIVNKNVTGVDENIVDEYNKPVVFGGHGEIIITGEYNNVSIYSISGQVYNSLQVPAGLYIVNVDGNTTKVIVK